MARLPLFEKAGDFDAFERVRVKPYQIIVWVSLGAAGRLELDVRSAGFPAILDPGNNHNFAIFRSQLLRWAGVSPDHLPIAGAAA